MAPPVISLDVELRYPWYRPLLFWLIRLRPSWASPLLALLANRTRWRIGWGTWRRFDG